MLKILVQIFFSKTEIYQFDTLVHDASSIFIFFEQYVFKFEVSVDVARLVNLFEDPQYFNGKV